MQLLLAADSATSYLTLALCARETESPDAPINLLAEITFQAGRRHAETILPAAESLLSQAGCTLQDLDLLAVTRGPGSFTGLRIGIAAWKGLAYALNLPLIGVPTLDAYSRQHAHAEGPLCIMLDARMGEVFSSVYRWKAGVRETLLPQSVLPPEAALDNLPPGTVFSGDGADRYAAQIRACYPDARILPPCLSAPRASALAWEAYSLYDANGPTDGALVEPVYLRKTQAETNRDLREAAARTE